MFAHSWHGDEKAIWKQSRRHPGMFSAKQCKLQLPWERQTSWDGRRSHVSSALLISLICIDLAWNICRDDFSLPLNTSWLSWGIMESHSNWSRTDRCYLGKQESAALHTNTTQFKAHRGNQGGKLCLRDPPCFCSLTTLRRQPNPASPRLTIAL